MDETSQKEPGSSATLWPDVPGSSPGRVPRPDEVKDPGPVRMVLALFLACLAVGLVSLVRGPHVEEKAKKEQKYDYFAPDDPLSAIRGSKEGVVLLRVDGPIMFEEPKFGAPRGADFLVKTLQRIATSDSAKAVVIRINSPGGTVAASQEIAAAVEEVRAHGKVVVISMADVAASGGYYISAPADYIFALPGTITGSIGVITQLPRYQEIAKKIGYDQVAFTSGAFKDMGNPFRDLREDEKDLFKKLIMRSYLQFVEAVASGRAQAIAKAQEEVKDRLAWIEELEALRTGQSSKPFAQHVREAAMKNGPSDEAKKAGESEEDGEEKSQDAESEEATPATTPAAEVETESDLEASDEEAEELDFGAIRKRVSEIADGRIYGGTEAHRLGLVDEIGGLKEAIRKAGELAELGPEPTILSVKGGRDFDQFMNLLGQSPDGLLGKLQGGLDLLLASKTPRTWKLPAHVKVAYYYDPGF